MVYIGLGANLGDREAAIRAAVERLDALAGVRVARVSALRETAPWGLEAQPAFLNGVAELEVDLAPRELLRELLAIERDLGRERDGERWGPRTIDLDVLVFGDEILEERGLTIPHPRLAERRFALEPLVELAPGLVVPGVGRADALLAALDDDSAAGVARSPTMRP